MATQTVNPGKHYKARFKNNFLTPSQRDSLAASNPGKKKWEAWIKKWVRWLIES